jgi:type IX secretion system PorP/SprF family membrane protein
MKTLKAILLLFLFTAGSAMAQDPLFTQYYANPIYTNPASAGAAKGGRAGLNYRVQWPELPGTFVTVSAAYDQYFKKLKSGFGFMYTNDRAGSGFLKTSTLNLIYSYEQKLGSKMAIRGGLQASYIGKSIDFDKLTFSDMIEPRSGFRFPSSEPLPNPVKTFLNFGAGVLLYSDLFYVGFATHNLTEPNQSFYNSQAPGNELPGRYTLHAGMAIPLDNMSGLPMSERITINPNVLFMQQSVFKVANFNVHLNYNFATIGTGYRFSAEEGQTVIAMIGFRAKKKLTMAYSYDRTFFDTQSVSSHEISLALRWRSKASDPDGDRIICPSF